MHSAGIPLGDLAQRGADVFQGAAKVLAPVCGDQNHAFVPGNSGQRAARRVVVHGGDHAQRVNHRVAGHVDGRRVHALAQQVLPGGLGGGKVQVGHHAGDPAVYFLRERLPFVAGAQPGLDVAHLHPVVKSRQAGRQHCGGVALHQNPVGLLARQHRVQLGEHARRQRSQGLVGLHQV